ncbi:hypothetical protein M0813_29750 [Anaeramoeba flamelloides]|uniref:Alpha-type protein kinase domain-containing protein n=1 Tax=Anaeramoeba flamelloides TaxID=1746091 RepID=A0AAV7Z6E9_9EUKA|nr:hypothetical protein M0812_16848 [Anaeramoeba flamelloides]KAJ6233445.1 hypothetical protein M0813_29750 [Anaeramoeba flamelloides]
MTWRMVISSDSSDTEPEEDNYDYYDSNTQKNNYFDSYLDSYDYDDYDDYDDDDEDEDSRSDYDEDYESYEIQNEGNEIQNKSVQKKSTDENGSKVWEKNLLAKIYSLDESNLQTQKPNYTYIGSIRQNEIPTLKSSVGFEIESTFVSNNNKEITSRINILPPNDKEYFVLGKSYPRLNDSTEDHDIKKKQIKLFLFKEVIVSQLLRVFRKIVSKKICFQVNAPQLLLPDQEQAKYYFIRKQFPNFQSDSIRQLSNLDPNCSQHQIISCFAHFTYQFNCGTAYSLITEFDSINVINLQYYSCEETFYSNLIDQYKDFIVNHKCNPLCEHLRLLPVKTIRKDLEMQKAKRTVYRRFLKKSFRGLVNHPKLNYLQCKQSNCFEQVSTYHKNFENLKITCQNCLEMN